MFSFSLRPDYSVPLTQIVLTAANFNDCDEVAGISKVSGSFNEISWETRVGGFSRGMRSAAVR